MSAPRGVVALVTQNPFPCDVDVRTRKFAATLGRGGYRAVVICHGHCGPGVNGLSNGVMVYGSFDGARSEAGSILRRPFPVNPWWTTWISELFRRERPKVVVVNGLRAFLPTYVGAKRFGIPVISDLSEHFPAMGQMQSRNGLQRLLKNRLSVSLLEALTVRLADEIWVVVEDQRQRLERLYGVARKIGIVSNTPMLGAAGEPGFNAQGERDGDLLTIGYFGLLERGRGLQHAIRALTYLPEPAQTRLVIVGDGHYKPELMALTRTLGLERHVHFRGWIASERLDEAISEFDVGIIPHFVCDFTHHTLPNKLFDFMRHGLPVLATPMRPVARVVEAEQCGMVIPEDPRGIARAIESFRMRRADLREMGRRGQAAVRDRYNWDRESEVILGSIERWIHGR